MSLQFWSRQFWLFGLAIAGTLIAGSANAQQCPFGSKIYVDPRLVPKRIPTTHLEIVQSQIDPYASPEEKERLVSEYWLQFRPIEIPYGRGRVFINPINPCMQQYFGP